MYIPDHNAFFIHIPKCGGNSIEFYFLRKAGIDVSVKNSVSVFNANKQFIIGKHQNKQTAHYAVSELQEEPAYLKADYRFTIVRHPVQRFLSEHAWRANNGMKCDIDQLLTELQTGNNYRLKSAWDYVSINNQNQMHDVFKLEEPEHIHAGISKRFNIEFEMPHENVTTNEKPILTQKQLEIIHTIWARDFEEFDYEIDQ